MIRFVQPLALLVLLVLPPLWIATLASWRATNARQMPVAARRTRARRWRDGLRHVSWRAWCGLLLPTLTIVALTSALAGAQWTQPIATHAVVFVLDRSDSVSADERSRAEAYVQQALAALPAGDRAGIVAFGQNALVARPLGTDRTLAPLAAQPNSTRTNIDTALELALAMLPPEGQRRLVLLSDGSENGGDAERAARLVAARGVPLDVVPFSSPPAALDVQVAAASVPHAVRAGQRLRLDVTTTAPMTTTAQVRVSDNGNLVSDQNATLPAGSENLSLDLPPATAGFHRYTVRVDVAGDARPQNNQLETYSVVQGPPRVLLVAAAPEDARNLADALTAGGVSIETQTPAAMPTTLGGLSQFDAVVLIDVPLRDLALATETLLPSYVRDGGHGLLMVGGPRSFGLGGYSGSPIETALPVIMAPQPTTPAPPIAVVVVIDISGSMGERAGKATKEQLAATGAARIAAQLRDTDEITVIPFDRTAHNTIGPLPGSQRDAITAQLNTIAPGAGGIDYFDSVSAAARYLRASSAATRHLITITDGNDTVQQEGAQDLVQQLANEGVTTTALAVGDGHDVPFLQGVARQGGGRFALAQTADSIPDFMSNEARLLLRSYLVTQPFTPAFAPNTAGSPILRGIPALPDMGGYVATTPKERTQVLIRAAQNDPLLAVWQYGLGYSAAWTSDMTGRWGRDLVQDPTFPRLATQLISRLLPPPATQALTLATTAQGDQLQLSATAHDASNRPADNLALTGQLLAADGSARTVTLREVAPGDYRTSVPVPPGTYEIRLVAADANNTVTATASGGAVLANFDEYRGAPTNDALLRALAQQTGGRVNPPPAAVYDPTAFAGNATRDLARPLMWFALLLVPLDLALRRLRFGGRWTSQAALESRGALALVDRVWRVAFGHEPFQAVRQRRDAKLQERDRWAAWMREQAQRRARGDE